MSRTTQQTKKALIIVDMQNDFVRQTGSLYVGGSEELIEPIKRLMTDPSNAWDLIVFTQDWHPDSHRSFETFPIHCVQNTPGAEIVSELRQHQSLPQITWQKAFMRHTDSLSAFTNDEGVCTGLCAILRTYQISDVYVAGVATEYCVKETAVGSASFGFRTFVRTDLIRAFDPSQSKPTLSELEQRGIELIH